MDKPESLKLCRDPTPSSVRLRSIRLDQPQRYNMHLQTINKWHKVREQAIMNRNWEASKIRNMTQVQVDEALKQAVTDMNNWLVKKETGEHPNNVFTNFLKKALGKVLGNIRFLDHENNKGLKPNNLLVDIQDNAVKDLHFYDTSWPKTGIELVKMLRITAARLDYRALAGMKTPGNLTINIASLGFESQVNTILGDINSFQFS